MECVERDVRVEGSPVRCPYCKGDLEDITKVVACAACGARHHGACRAEHGRCASCGAESVLTAHRSARGLEQPRGSRIKLVEEGGVVRLRYAVAPSIRIGLVPTGSPRRLLALLLALLGAASLVGLPCVIALADGPLLVISFSVLFTTAAVTFVAAVVSMVELRSVVGPDAVITLGEQIEFPLAPTWRKKAARADLGQVRTERVSLGEYGHEYRLTVDLGVERVRVFTGQLKEPEVDWIADVIRAWKDA